MNNFFILFTWIIGCHLAFAQSPPAFASFSSLPNDWVEKFEFKAAEKERAGEVSVVLVMITSKVEEIDTLLSDPKWANLFSRHDLGIVALGYELQTKAPTGKNQNAVPFAQADPKKAREILSAQLEERIASQYPKAKKIAYYIQHDKAWIAINMIVDSPRDTLFWIMDDFVWCDRERARSLPMGLAISRDAEAASAMLEAQQVNRKLKHRITYVRDAAESRDAVDKFIAQYVELIVSDNFKRSKPVITDLRDETLFSSNPTLDQIPSTSWLPDIGLVKAWQDLHLLTKQEKLAEIVEEAVDTNIPEQPELTLYLKMPILKAGEDVQGVLCLATFMDEKQSMYDILRRGVARKDLLTWAEDQKMAVITWNVKTIWPITLGQAELERAEARLYAKTADLLAGAWDRGIRTLITKYKIPESNYFCYGNSRGSMMAHRIVIRKPERFLAVQFHVANSYDIPTHKAKNVFWLITTGELDGGYAASIDFFRKCQNLDYPIIFKAGLNLGHTESPKIERLGFEVFQYALSLKKKSPYTKVINPAQQQKIADKFRYDLSMSDLIGDFINQGVYRKDDASWIPEEQRVSLITEEIAKAWGEEMTE